MANTPATTTTGKRTFSTKAMASLSALLFVGSCMQWVVWETEKVSGYHFATGQFFTTAKTLFNIDNPVPELAVLNNIFWLIPVLALATVLLEVFKKKNSWLTTLTGILTLSLATVFVLFTDLLVTMGYVKSLSAALLPFFYLSVFCAILLIILSLRHNIFLLVIALLIGPFATWAGFAFVTNQEMNKTFEGTESLKPDYTVNALDLIREVTANDTAGIKKYSGKIVEVNGIITNIENANDSTINIQMADTTGSYIVFPFYNKTLAQVKTLKDGDSVSIKGAFSGSMYSEILETTIINFERNTLNKQNK